MTGHGPQPLLPIELVGGERICRFLFSDRQYSSQKRLVKPGAFNPSPYNELSVGHISGLEAQEVWVLGEVVRLHVGKPRLDARADLAVATILQKQLRAVRDDQDYERHTNVIGWPTIEEDDARKRVWKHVASHLADNATLHLPTD